MVFARQLTPFGEKVIKDVADRHAVSVDVVRTLLFALEKGGGTLAQFNHIELGGSGQWMKGGMTMVGDMFNDRLRATVNAVCSELSSVLNTQDVFVPVTLHGRAGGLIAPGNAWWPAELGSPSSTGSQGDVRYAYFPHVHRIAILRDGKVELYDTLGHDVSGVQQQQQQQSSFPGTLMFTSQNGTFSISTLPKLSPSLDPGTAGSSSSPPEPATPSPVAISRRDAGPSQHSPEEILKTLERLAEVHQKGILSEDEFRRKKAELLSRL
jgi:hypothetical protein